MNVSARDLQLLTVLQGFRQGALPVGVVFELRFCREVVAGGRTLRNVVLIAPRADLVAP